MEHRSISIPKIIFSTKKYFIADLLIWFLAHNIPLLSALFVKKYFDQKMMEQNISVVIIIFVLLLFRGGAIEIGARVDIIAQQKWSLCLYEQAMVSLQESFDEKKDQGQLVDAINADVSQIVGTISYGIDTCCNLLYAMIAGVILLFINIPLTFILFILPVFAMFLNYILKAKIGFYSQSLKMSVNQFASIIGEIMHDRRSIRINGLEKQIYERTKRSLHEVKESGEKSTIFLAILNGLTQMITEVNIFILLFAFTKFRSVQQGAMILFITYSFDIAEMAQYISSLFLSYSQMKVYIDDFEMKFLNSNKIDRKCLETAIDIKKNKMNVLIGPNGSGKTTYLKEIFHQHPNSVLLQIHPKLLHMSIEENIRLNDVELNSVALQTAQCSFEEFSRGKDEIVERGASNLSGGQIFRIALARTLQHAKDLILIDNNFTSVDEKARLKILQDLQKTHKTVVFVDVQDREEYQGMNRIFIRKTFCGNAANNLL